jgi:hypothetical protein
MRQKTIMTNTRSATPPVTCEPVLGNRADFEAEEHKEIRGDQKSKVCDYQYRTRGRPLPGTCRIGC